MKIVKVTNKAARPIVKKVLKKYKNLTSDLKARFHKLYPNAQSRKPLYVYDAEKKKVKVLPMNFKGVLYYVMYPLISLRKKMKVIAVRRLAKQEERRKLKIGSKEDLSE